MHPLSGGSGDEVLAAGTLVVETPNLLARSITVGGDYLIVEIQDN